MGHNNSPALLYEASKPLKDKGVHVFALAMGKEKYQDKNGLGQIASSPCSTYVIQEREFTLLPEKIAQSQATQCKRKYPYPFLKVLKVTNLIFKANQYPYLRVLYLMNQIYPNL